MLAITSFSQNGYEKYGRRCLESYVKHWPCKIVVWYEEKPDFKHDKVEYRNLLELPNLKAYLTKLSTVADSDGVIGRLYNYNLDARKFCRKVFAQDSVFDEDDKVFWLDADTITFKDVPESFLSGLVEGVPFCYLGRTEAYTETGFLGFNTRHPEFAAFRAGYLSAFTKGRIFTKPAWHDCIAFDMARGGIKGRNLNTSPLQGLDNCFPYTVLGDYIIHNKGPARKLRAYG